MDFCVYCLPANLEICNLGSCIRYSYSSETRSEQKVKKKNEKHHNKGVRQE